MRKLIVPVSLLLVLSSCWGLLRRPPGNFNQTKVWGYTPVYSNDSTLLRIHSSGPRAVQFPGKIYVKGNLIFQCEHGAGIHIIDKTNPSAPARIGFINVLGASEISIKGNYLYTNSFTDLVVVDVSDWQNVSEVKRFPHAFSQGGSVYRYDFMPLPEHNVYFDCNIDPMAIQTGWARDSVYRQCYYP